jgi:hypothetical protein
MNDVEVVALNTAGLCPRCGADYGPSGGPHDDERRAAEAHDHARAGERGDRLRRIANEVVSRMLAAGIIRDPRGARVIAFHVLADHLYGNKSIDIPTELGKP